jgi:alkanesulfonate monooxygenase SsuD/methylene tetrahydromethanopterin reductase-like flavin-dependent oxidoreductase (luciferase family)
VPERFADRVQQIEDLGFDGIWFAEAYALTSSGRWPGAPR